MMKSVRVFASLACGLAIALLVSCTTLIPSGTIVEKDFALSGFTTVDVSNAFECTITEGKGFSVVANVDQNVADSVEIFTNGATLVVRLKDNVFISGNMTMKVAVTMPALAQLNLSGASSGSASGFTAGQDSLGLTVSGASTAVWTGGAVNALSLNVSGASTVKLLAINSQSLNATVAGASNVTGTPGSAVTASLSLDLSGASTMAYDVSGSVSGSVSGASTFKYGLSPATSGLSSSGGSTIGSR